MPDNENNANNNGVSENKPSGGAQSDGSTTPVVQFHPVHRLTIEEEPTPDTEGLNSNPALSTRAGGLANITPSTKDSAPTTRPSRRQSDCPSSAVSSTPAGVSTSLRRPHSTPPEKSLRPSGRPGKNNTIDFESIIRSVIVPLVHGPPASRSARHPKEDSPPGCDLGANTKASISTSSTSTSAPGGSMTVLPTSSATDSLARQSMNESATPTAVISTGNPPTNKECTDPEPLNTLPNTDEAGGSVNLEGARHSRRKESWSRNMSELLDELRISHVPPNTPCTSQPAQSKPSTPPTQDAQDPVAAQEESNQSLIDSESPRLAHSSTPSCEIPSGPGIRGLTSQDPKGGQDILIAVNGLQNCFNDIFNGIAAKLKDPTGTVNLVQETPVKDWDNWDMLLEPMVDAILSRMRVYPMEIMDGSLYRQSSTMSTTSSQSAPADSPSLSDYISPLTLPESSQIVPGPGSQDHSPLIPFGKWQPISPVQLLSGRHWQLLQPTSVESPRSSRQYSSALAEIQSSPSAQLPSTPSGQSPTRKPHTFPHLQAKASPFEIPSDLISEVPPSPPGALSQTPPLPIVQPGFPGEFEQDSMHENRYKTSNIRISPLWNQPERDGNDTERKQHRAFMEAVIEMESFPPDPFGNEDPKHDNWLMKELETKRHWRDLVSASDDD